MAPNLISRARKSPSIAEDASPIPELLTIVGLSAAEALCVRFADISGWDDVLEANEVREPGYGVRVHLRNGSSPQFRWIKPENLSNILQNHYGEQFATMFLQSELSGAGAGYVRADHLTGWSITETASTMHLVGGQQLRLMLTRDALTAAMNADPATLVVESEPETFARGVRRPVSTREDSQWLTRQKGHMLSVRAAS